MNQSQQLNYDSNPIEESKNSYETIFSIEQPRHEQVQSELDSITTFYNTQFIDNGSYAQVLKPNKTQELCDIVKRQYDETLKSSQIVFTALQILYNSYTFVLTNNKKMLVLRDVIEYVSAALQIFSIVKNNRFVTYSEKIYRQYFDHVIRKHEDTDSDDKKIKKIEHDEAYLCNCDLFYVVKQKLIDAFKAQKKRDKKNVDKSFDKDWRGFMDTKVAMIQSKKTKTYQMDEKNAQAIDLLKELHSLGVLSGLRCTKDYDFDPGLTVIENKLINTEVRPSRLPNSRLKKLRFNTYKATPDCERNLARLAAVENFHKVLFDENDANFDQVLSEETLRTLTNCMAQLCILDEQKYKPQTETPKKLVNASQAIQTSLFRQAMYQDAREREEQKKKKEQKKNTIMRLRKRLLKQRATIRRQKREINELTDMGDKLSIAMHDCNAIALRSRRAFKQRQQHSKRLGKKLGQFMEGRKLGIFPKDYAKQYDHLWRLGALGAVTFRKALNKSSTEYFQSHLARTDSVQVYPPLTKELSLYEAMSSAPLLARYLVNRWCIKPVYLTPQQFARFSQRGCQIRLTGSCPDIGDGSLVLMCHALQTDDGEFKIPEEDTDRAFPGMCNECMQIALAKETGEYEETDPMLLPDWKEFTSSIGFKCNQSICNKSDPTQFRILRIREVDEQVPSINPPIKMNVTREMRRIKKGKRITDQIHASFVTAQITAQRQLEELQERQRLIEEHQHQHQQNLDESWHESQFDRRQLADGDESMHVEEDDGRLPVNFDQSDDEDLAQTGCNWGEYSDDISLMDHLTNVYNTIPDAQRRSTGRILTQAVLDAKLEGERLNLQWQNPNEEWQRRAFRTIGNLLVRWSNDAREGQYADRSYNTAYAYACFATMYSNHPYIETELWFPRDLYEKAVCRPLDIFHMIWNWCRLQARERYEGIEFN